MIARDMMRNDAPAARAELELLRATKVGDTREAPLLPALDVDLEWVCTSAAESRWEYEVRLFDVTLYRVEIVLLPETMTLDMKEV